MSNKFNRVIPDLLRRAGEVMLRATSIEDGDNLMEKGSAANLVTVYDIKVQELVIAGLKEAFPRATFVAEEKDNSKENTDGECCFILDPIDGTANFTRGFRHSCISLAATRGGRVVYSAIYDPYQDEMFSAELGEGMTVNGRRVSVTPHDISHSLILFGTSPYKKSELGRATFAIAESLYSVCSDVRRCGSAALDLAYLAAGRADGFFELTLSPWDFAAGLLMIEESGGRITDLDGNRPSLNAPCPIIAGYGEVYEAVKTAVKKEAVLI